MRSSSGMSRVVAWGTAIWLGASSAACTVLFPFSAGEPPDPGPFDTDDRADAATPPADTCGQVVATARLPGPAIGVALAADRLLAAWAGGGVEQLDIGDRSRLVVVGSLSVEGPTGRLDSAPCSACPSDVTGRQRAHAYVPGAAGLEVVSDDPQLRVVARLEADSSVVDAEVDPMGKRAVASFEDGHVGVLDLAPLVPGPEIQLLRERQSTIAPCSPGRVAVTHTQWNAVAIDGPGCEPALFAFWLAPDGTVRDPSTLPIGGPPRDLADMRQIGLLVAAGPAGLRLMRYEDSPTLVTVPSPGGADALAVIGRFALVAEGSTVRILDLAEPSSPELRGEVVLPGAPLDMTFGAGTLFAALGDEGVAVVDVSCHVDVEDDPLIDGRLDGGDGQEEAPQPPAGPTPCDPARVATLSADGRLQCASGCRGVPFGDALWCTTDCARDEDCADAKSICDPEASVCVRQCVTDADCLDVGLHRCDAAGGGCT